MVDWVEELKIEQAKSLRRNRWKQYQAYNEQLKQTEVGVMRGNTFKRVDASNLHYLFKKYVR